MSSMVLIHHENGNMSLVAFLIAKFISVGFGSHARGFFELTGEVTLIGKARVVGDFGNG